MKGPVGLACLCWLLATVGPSVQLLPTSAGHTYTYEVETSILAGIPELADQYSGISLLYTIKLDAVSKNKAIFTFQNVRLGKLNEEVPVSYSEDIQFQHSPSPHYERELSKPLIVHFDEQEITKIEVPESEPTWSVNLKKAIVAKFQLDLKSKSNPAAWSGDNQIPRIDPSSSVYSVYEDGIGGECETRYSILSVPSMDHPDQSEDVLNVTKVKNFRNCRSRPIFETDNFDSQGCQLNCEPKSSPQSKNLAGIWRESSSVYESGCPFGFEPDHHPVKSYSIVWYNISSASHNPLIEDIQSEHKTVYNFNGQEIVVVSQTNVTLVKKSGLRSQLPTITRPVKHESLEYQWPEVPYLDNDDSSFYAILGPVQESDIKQSTLRMIEDLVNGIIPTEPETSQGAGQSVVQIVNALSVLKKPALEQLYNELSSEKLQKVPKKRQLMRKAFLDIAAIAASDEVALFIRDLIVSKRVSDWEAAELVQGIGKNSDEPSDEVIQAYMELWDLPRVQKGRRLLASVGIALARMIQDSCVEEDDPKPSQLLSQPKTQQPQPQPHPRSPKRWQSSEEDSSPPPRSPKFGAEPEEEESQCSPQELQSYIKAFVEKLENSKTVNKILAYLEALAHIGTPDVLPYIKPYVTGEAPNAEALDDEDTAFVSLNAIYALHELASSSPDEVLPIVSSVYFDPSNDYDQRIAAFSVLMSTDPPLTLLERIATELNSEISNHVGSYVYSRFSDIANSTLPCDRKMAQKIQLVFSHAPDLDLGLQFASTAQYSYYDDDNDYGLHAIVKHVPSNTSILPRSFYSSLDFITGPFRDRYFEFGSTAKGLEELIEKLTEPSGIISQLLSSLGSTVQSQNIPRVIDIVKNRLLFASPDTDIPRAVFFLNIFNKVNYLSVDEKYVVEFLENAIEYFRRVDASSGYSANYVKIWMPSSFLRIVPSGAGLPIVVSQRNPVIWTMSLENTRISSNKKKQAPLTSAIAMSTNLDMKVHVDSIAMAFVVDPVSDQIHGAAFEQTTEMAFANLLEFALDLENDNYALSWKPKMPQQVFYHNSRPSTFIGRADIIRQPKSEWLGDVNEIETVPEPFKYDTRHEARPLGLTLRVTGDSESPWSDIPLFWSDTADSDGLFAAFLEMAVNPEMINRELHVYLEPHRKNPISEIVFSADYDDSLKFVSPKPDKESSEEDDDEEYEQALSSLYGKSYRGPDAHTAIEKLIKKTQPTWAPVLGHGHSDPVPATVVHSLELTMVVKGDRSQHHALRLLYAHSLGFRSNWFEAVAHCPGGEYDRPFQLCSSLCAAYPEMPNPFYLQMNTLKSQSAKFAGEIGWGSDCQRQSQIRIQGEMKKSEQQLSSSSGIYESPKDQQSLPWYFKQCQVDKTEGNSQSYACQLAILDDSQLKAVELEVIAPKLSPAMLNMTCKLDLLAKYLMYPNLEFNPVASNEEGKLSIVLEYSDQVPDNPLVNIEVRKPTETLFFSKLYLPYYEPPSTLYSYEETFMDQFFGDAYYPECNLMENYIQTFDNVTVELPENQCQYILAHDSSADSSYTIIASQIDLQSNTKALSMVLAGHSIKVLPPRGEAFSIVLDDQEREVVPSKPIVLDFDKESELRIFTRLTSAPTESPILVIIAPDDNIQVKYDGKNALIKMSRDFQGDQVGLCGDFNEEQFQEFTGPLKCTYVHEKDFVKSYAIPGQSCPKPPKPQGPAFCPPGVSYKPSGELEHSEEEDEDESDLSPPSSRFSKPGSPKRERWSHPSKAPRTYAVPQRLEEWRDMKPHKAAHSSQSDESLEEPEGPSDCVRQYTHTFEDSEGRTCFSTQPVHSCHPQCRSVHAKPKPVPYHCMPAGQLQRQYKEQARRGVVHELQNKPVEKTRIVHIPEKCM